MSEPVDQPDDDDDVLDIPMNSVPNVLHEGESDGVFIGLFDVRFRKINAVRMAPLAYVAVTILSGAGCILLDVVAFWHSTTVGIITSFLITPALFVTLVILARFVLEFMLSLLVLPSHLTQVTNSVLGILGTTTTIVGTTTDISSDTAHLGIMHPLKKIRLSKRQRIVPYN
ncbi:DUF4282 domain-containing protein [Smaragdicoccus niigatensis]|uniref:DUF4282 domain-containing protein n=1 Tax=Smaragdicoccus niigatensis TaxID=359359 RepID=UPI00035CF5D8|nr:DUF4282 domain-containing protein [Smaragdicoccus niigatensis]